MMPTTINHTLPTIYQQTLHHLHWLSDAGTQKYISYECIDVLFSVLLPFQGLNDTNAGFFQTFQDLPCFQVLSMCMRFQNW